MEGMCNSLLTLLPLSSLTFNEEGSGSFEFNHFSSLATQLFCFAIMFYILGYLIVMTLVHVIDFWALVLLCI